MNKLTKIALPIILAACSLQASAKDFTTVTAGYIFHTDSTLEDNKNQFDRSLLTVANVRVEDWGRIATVGIFENLEQSSSDPMATALGEAWSTFKFSGVANIKTGFIPGLNYMVDEFFWANTNGYESNMKLGLSYDMKLAGVKLYFGGGANYVSIDNAGARYDGFSGYAFNTSAQYPITDKISIKARYFGVFDRVAEHAIGYTDKNDAEAHNSGYMADIALTYKFDKSLSVSAMFRQNDSWYGYKTSKADMFLLTGSYTF
ncbi:hypothetical protein JK628_00870 [Shewanella sp. KX20019]|uniref:hypothetical protein n=1 Tax=Shewanella sp. KX20019 TaxID=2803864 RepID=UPI001927058C|nr:hypothetical protein [Shewanella sp. KX20019]QQX80466.1 hypothetical protein JK628_00870 [Shewanella sp. KX20019]